MEQYIPLHGFYSLSGKMLWKRYGASKLLISSLRDLARSCDKTSYHSVNWDVYTPMLDIVSQKAQNQTQLIQHKITLHSSYLDQNTRILCKSASKSLAWCMMQMPVRISPQKPSNKNKFRAPWASYHIRKIPGCACAGNAGKVFSSTTSK